MFDVSRKATKIAKLKKKVKSTKTVATKSPDRRMRAKFSTNLKDKRTKLEYNNRFNHIQELLKSVQFL